MAVSAQLTGPFLALASAKNLDLAADTIKVTLHTSTMTPSVAWDYADHLTNEVAAAGGYTTGGATLASKTLAYTAAGSLTAWAANTSYTAGDVRRKTVDNGHAYICIVAGTSHATTEPIWPTGSRATITDGTVTWAECGHGVVVFDAADLTWAASTITARYAWLQDATPGSAATNPLIGYVDFGADLASSAGNFTITWHPQGIVVLPIG